MEGELFSTEEFEVKGEKVKEKKAVSFIPYEVSQNYLFPPSTDDYLPPNHIARLVNVLIDRMDLSDIIKTYKGGGRSAYHPRMLLKVWILGYLYKKYTTRELERALKENIAFIWISGQSTPNFRTLNNFRLRLNNSIKKIFKQIVMEGIRLGIIEGKNIFIDHTKIEANANSHRVVWRKQVEKQLNKINGELDDLLDYIDKLNEEADEDDDNGGNELRISNMDEDKLNLIVEKINNQINKKQISKEKGKEIKSNIRRTKELLKRKEKYNQKLETLNDRNSYSITDNDATVMRQKDGKTSKPSYNEGIATENGFVLNYEVGQNRADNKNFKEVLNGAIDNIGKIPENVIADSAYGSYENMVYIKEMGIGNYLKYNSYDREKSFKWRREKVRKQDFVYNADKDCFVCVMGKELHFHEIEVDDRNGIEKKIRVYKADESDCKNCKIKSYCTNGRSRSIHVLFDYEKLREEAKNNLDSEKGQFLMKLRKVEVESHFGDRKRNSKYGRYVLRGLNKVNIEAGLYYMGVNIKKIYKHILSKIAYLSSMKALKYTS